MCGILGTVGHSIEDGAFERGLETLASRGPDASASRALNDGRVRLGHRRLAIIDLTDDGLQPMCNEDGTLWLVFNGEIYNYRELRSQLLASGHRFRSRADSEVLLHGFEEWGEEILDRLNGIFAFAIWSTRDESLFLARDPLGVKPLYVAASGGAIAFASTPGAMIRAGVVPARVDAGAIGHYLSLGYVPQARTAFDGVDKLASGHSAVWQDGKLSVRRYWKPVFRPEIVDADEAEAAIRSALGHAVEGQLVSDVPVGVFLSGGIDSSLVAALVREARGDRIDVDGFCLGFTKRGADERPYARLAADRIGIRLKEGVLEAEGAALLLNDFIRVYDEPFNDSSAFPTMAVSKLAVEHGYKVVLTGDGGDELFAGYRWYDRYAVRPDRSTLAERLRGVFGSTKEPSNGRLRAYLDVIGIAPTRWVRDVMSKTTLEATGCALEPFRRHWQPGLDPVASAQILDLQTYLVDDILTKVDRASMAFGLEARVPLLDIELVETALRIAPHLHYAEGRRKSLLKQAASGTVPAEILTERKKGFSIPIDPWMDSTFQPLVDRFVPEGFLVQTGVLDPDGVRRGLRSRGRLRWILLALELWARHWLAGEAIETLTDGVRRP